MTPEELRDKLNKLALKWTPTGSPIDNAKKQLNLINQFKESVCKEWTSFNEIKPEDDYMILVTNGSFVEICYYENGELEKPFAFDKDDNPVFCADSEKKLYWKRIFLPE